MKVATAKDFKLGECRGTHGNGRRGPAARSVRGSESGHPPMTDAELQALWDRFVDIVAPRRFPTPAPVPPHDWTPSKWYRAGVETSPGHEAYPGCIVCGVSKERHV